MSDKKSFSIQIEAVDTSGNRILDDTVYANDLGAGQSQDFEAFKLVSSDKIEALKSATFKIVSSKPKRAVPLHTAVLMRKRRAVKRCPN